jgi:hypothetical protein
VPLYEKDSALTYQSLTSRAHPYAVAMECAPLARKAGVSLYNGKTLRTEIKLAVRHVHTFAKAK